MVNSIFFPHIYYQGHCDYTLSILTPTPLHLHPVTYLSISGAISYDHHSTVSEGQHRLLGVHRVFPHGPLKPRNAPTALAQKTREGSGHCGDLIGVINIHARVTPIKDGACNIARSNTAVVQCA